MCGVVVIDWGWVYGRDWWGEFVRETGGVGYDLSKRLTCPLLSSAGLKYPLGLKYPRQLYFFFIENCTATLLCK